MKTSDYKILVAEDEPKARQLYKEVLVREGYDVLTVEDGLSAIEELKQGDVDLFITDLKMPGMDAMVMLPDIRFRYPDLPIIVVTAHYQDMKEQFDEKGLTVHFFNKPVNMNVLKAEIEDIRHDKKGKSTVSSGK